MGQISRQLFPLVVIVMIQVIMADRRFPGAPETNPGRRLQKRVGPFFTNPKRPYVYNHPYMQNPQTQQQYIDPNRISNRKLLLPIISSGYSSAVRVQGGQKNNNQLSASDEEKSGLKMEANVIEQAQVQEITEEPQRTTTSTTTTTATTTTTTSSSTRTSTSIPSSASADIQPGQPLSSPYFPQIPELVSHESHYQASSDYDPNNPFIIRENEYGQPSPNQIKKLPQRPARPSQDYNIPPRSTFNIGSGSVETVSLFDTEPSAPSPAAPSVDTQSNQYVRIVATPPKQVSIVSNERLPLSKVDSEGFFKPPRSEYSNTYQAGYEQLDFPGQSGRFPDNINPALIDPDDYHQDRPSFQASDVQHSTHKEYYPLGKPPKPARVTPEILSQGQEPKGQPQADRKADQRKPEKQSSSFLDFLVPSFLRSSSRSDPEGPPRPKAPRTPQGPPGPKNGPLPHLQRPNRPPNTFPHPLELGGKFNPILLRIPSDGSYPGGGISVPAPPHVALKKRLYAPDNNVIEDDVITEEEGDLAAGKTKPRPIVNMPPPPPLLRRPRPANAPLKMTKQPIAGLGQVPHGPYRSSNKKAHKRQRPVKQQPRQSTKRNQALPKPPKGSLLPVGATIYRKRLQDANFHQDVTKAHVYHAVDLDQAPILDRAPVTYIQPANPFNFKPDDAPSTYGDVLRPRIEVDPNSPELVDFAPPSRPIRNDRPTIEKPQVVYVPESTTESPTVPDASHVAYLLEQYLAEEGQQFSDEDPVAGADNADYLSLIKEHLSPSPDVDSINLINEQPDGAKNGEKFSMSLNQVFEPSSETKDADWFILNSNGTRQIIKDEPEASTTKLVAKENEIDADDDNNKAEKRMEGNFRPVAGPPSSSDLS